MEFTCRKRADLFLVCNRSVETSAADLQIVYRSTDDLQNVCRISAKCLQNVCRFCRRRRYTVNPLLSPPGGLFFSSTFEGGLNREGGLKREGGLI